MGNGRSKGHGGDIQIDFKATQVSHQLYRKLKSN